ncbi:hypothetical protein PybrP1_002009 [[Pythium] brassicae (nom. inval.)]|nr:hypothetical protein PybrP1_002009 [[Pythium] brassicae (nom. inval.)]
MALLECSLAANWAQVSGTRHTNAVVLAATPWTQRHGHAAAALDFSDEHVRSTGQKARMFVIGGDSSVQGKQNLRAYPGGGTFRNDVWASTGVFWRVESNILKTTKWGDPLPQIIANVSWLQTNAGKRPPRGITYKEWTACAAAAWAIEPVTGCGDASKPPGAYLSDNMFSPRRNFVATAFRNELFVLGGRAREHFPVPEEMLRGGVRTIGPRNARWREFAVLKNDVWRSSDAGASWKLVTPGCLMPQASLVHKAGKSAFQCETDDQCEGDSSCKLDHATSTGFCVCNMWSPREFHAVAVHDGAFFLSGGYALMELGNCGVEENARKRPSGEEFACSGGYRAYMNDMWTSTDGQHWVLLTLHAGFAPRGEHAMVSFKAMLHIFGGRTGDALVSANRQLLHDVWTSSDGKLWSERSAAAPWSVRSKHVVVVLPGSTDPTSGDDLNDELVLMYGEDEERALDDVWTWRGGDAAWVRDYAPDTDAGAYVSSASSVSYLRGMLDQHALVLNAAGISTVSDLTALSFELTVQLRERMPICDYIALAKQVVATCTVDADTFDGQELADEKVARGQETAAATESTAAAAASWDGCSHIGTMVLDATTRRTKWPDVNGVDQVQILRDVFDDAQASVCKWGPSPRTGHAGVVFQRKVFAFGGLTAPDYFENDVWYRDKRRPKAQFTLVPPTRSSDTVFAFASDKPGCLFEYHVTNMVEMLVVRNWTRSLGQVDFLSWLDGGTYRFRVRALDPAGNVDGSFETGRNEYEWVYVPKLPWGLLVGLSAAALVLLVGFFLEWRKRRKRAAMERYAMKRMRRKLKGKKAEGGDENWRETYDNAKDKDGGGSGGAANKNKKKTKKGKVVGVKAVAGTKTAAAAAAKDKKKKKSDKKKTKEKADKSSGNAKKKGDSKALATKRADATKAKQVAAGEKEKDSKSKKKKKVDKADKKKTKESSKKAAAATTASDKKTTKDKKTKEKSRSAAKAMTTTTKKKN